jgi:hypothetical protein
MKVRAILAPLLIGTSILLSAPQVGAATESPQTAAVEPMIAAAAAAEQTAASPAGTPNTAAPSARTSEVGNPLSAMQIAGALGGALVGILFAIAGVTVTFKSMRNEMRRGRGHSRRPPRSDRGTLPQT